MAITYSACLGWSFFLLHAGAVSSLASQLLLHTKPGKRLSYWGYDARVIEKLYNDHAT